MFGYTLATLVLEIPKTDLNTARKLDRYFHILSHTSVFIYRLVPPPSFEIGHGSVNGSTGVISLGMLSGTTPWARGDSVISGLRPTSTTLPRKSANYFKIQESPQAELTYVGMSGYVGSLTLAGVWPWARWPPRLSTGVLWSLMQRMLPRGLLDETIAETCWLLSRLGF